jgi:hypothetical protein
MHDLHHNGTEEQAAKSSVAVSSHHYQVNAVFLDVALDVEGRITLRRQSNPPVIRHL